MLNKDQINDAAECRHGLSNISCLSCKMKGPAIECVKSLANENKQLRITLNRHYKKSGICHICGLSKFKHTDWCEFKEVLT